MESGILLHVYMLSSSGCVSETRGWQRKQYSGRTCRRPIRDLSHVLGTVRDDESVIAQDEARLHKGGRGPFSVLFDRG